MMATFKETIIAWLLSRIYKENKNNLIIICGPTGSGKSWRSLRIAELLSPNFNMSYVVFSVEELLDLIKSGKLKKGDVVVFEEGGVGASSRNWYTILNKALLFCFQTMRHRNFTLIMNVPSMSFIDSGLRPLFHLYIETLFIDKQKDMCRCKVWRIQHNAYEGESYTKYFICEEPVDEYDAISVWIGPPQTPGLIDEYERRKWEYTTKLYQSLSDDIRAEKEHAAIDWSKPKDIDDIIVEVKENIKEYQTIVNKKRMVDWKKIANKFKIGSPTAKRVKTAVSS